MLLKPVTTGQYQSELRTLFSEYVGWIIQEINQRWTTPYSQDDVADFVESDMQTLDRMLPPKGIFYLAYLDDELAGMGGLKQLSDKTGELKRMYVRETVRGQGVGKQLLDQLLADARSLHYDTMYLDSPKFSENAQLLYQSRGFYYIDDAYPGNENPRENDFMMDFMQLDL